MAIPPDTIAVERASFAKRRLIAFPFMLLEIGNAKRAPSVPPATRSLPGSRKPPQGHGSNARILSNLLLERADCLPAGSQVYGADPGAELPRERDAYPVKEFARAVGGEHVFTEGVDFWTAPLRRAVAEKEFFAKEAGGH
jgi:hypothetical protein